MPTHAEIESYDEQISRVRLMASGNETWDLSDNDCAALTAVTARLEQAEAIVAAAQAWKAAKADYLKVAYTSSAGYQGYEVAKAHQDIYEAAEADLLAALDPHSAQTGGER